MVVTPSGEFPGEANPVAYTEVNVLGPTTRRRIANPMSAHRGLHRGQANIQ
jgi:hypothetical protein